MKYNEKITLKNGKKALLRNGEGADGKSVLDVFDQIHAETDFLLTYPDENSFDSEREAAFLHEKTDSQNEIEILAIVDDKIVGTAGISAIGTKVKIRHRAEFGISILREYWGLGLGKALTKACIQCAKDAGYVQLELNARKSFDKSLYSMRQRRRICSVGIECRCRKCESDIPL